jgi:hypothetical protein
VLRLLRRARRRFLLNGLLEEGANALAGALAGFILLLILGAQILDWRLILLLPIGAAGAGLYRLRRRLPSAYRIAQIIDRRLELADTLSTAVFFSSESSRYAAPAMRESQLAHAERVAASADANLAIPFTMPRSTYALAALALVASSLFGLRYGLQRGLDLRLPLTTILAQNLGLASPNQEAKSLKKGAKSEVLSDQNSDGSALDPDQPVPGDMDSISDELMLGEKGQPETGDAAESSQTENDPNASGKQQSASSNQDQAGDMEQPPGDMEGSEGQKGSQKSGGQSESSRDSEDGQGGGSSLLSKLQNAMQNLLSKVAPQSGGNQQPSNGQNGKPSQSGGAKQQGGDKQQAGAQQPDGQGGDPGDQADNEQDDESTGAGSSGEQPTSKMAGSGIGSQNGDKSVKQAEQLAAMGKISEIIGKRAANVTGEAMIEVQNTKQQVRTPYAQRDAEHTEGGAEISRDEVPAALQTYIEQYFEQIHKQDKTGGSKSK